MNRRFALVFLVAALVGLTPSGGIAAEGDVVFKRRGAEAGGTPPAVFPHWIHRIRYKCYACHPGLYKIKGENKITMEQIMQGKSCGVCHNGKIAWGVTFDSCSRCHPAKK